MTRALVILVLTVAFTARAAAGTAAIVVFGTERAPRESFVQALAIQLLGDARVTAGPVLQHTQLPSRIDEVVTALRERQATVGVWLDAIPRRVRAPASARAHAKDAVRARLRRTSARGARSGRSTHGQPATTRDHLRTCRCARSAETDRVHPARDRWSHSGVGTTLTITNDVDVGGFLYLARGKLESSNPLEVFGGIIAGDLRNTGATTIHYDRQVLETGAVCPPENTCDSCMDCGNQACVNGTCGACTTGADCCSPLSCVAGECILVLL